MLLFLLPLLFMLPTNLGTSLELVYLSSSHHLPTFSSKNPPELVKLVSNSASVTRPVARRPYHKLSSPVVSPSLVSSPGCGQSCNEPFVSAPIGSPCACVIPMRVRLRLGVGLFAVFPEVSELAREVAAGTYLKQNQVDLIGASGDSPNQGRTVVDINLTPLGDKFDNTTALLTYQRFFQKKVPLNRRLFGDYDVIYIKYPGLPPR